MRIRLFVLVLVLVATGVVAYIHLRDAGYFNRGAGQSVIAQKSQTEVDRNEEVSGSILPREMVRQAWLMAQRDELGLPTRDSLLREPPLSPGTTVPDIEVVVRRHSCDVRTVAGTPDKQKWSTTLSGENWSPQYGDMVAAAEKLSRTLFPDAIHGMGIQGAAPKIFQGPAPDLHEAEQLLGQINLFSQFEAVRTAHDSIRQVGPSPTALGILVRGYANLGQLTRPLWNATAKGLAVRSVLYAQKMVVLAPPGDQAAMRLALWHRAYAMTMLGLQSDADDNFDSAAKLGGDAPSDWVLWTQAYCHFQTSKLTDMTAAAPAGQEQLPAFLTFLSIEHTASPSAIHQFGGAVLQEEPDNPRIIDTMSRYSGVAALHALTIYAIQATAKGTCQHLATFADVPEKVKAAVKTAESSKFKPEDMAAIANDLVEAGGTDRGEPSWTALGRMLQDLNFRNVERRVFFEARMWNVNPSATATALAPLIAGHPYKAYIGYLASAQPGAAIQNMQVVDPQPDMLYMLTDLASIGAAPKDGSGGSWPESMMYHLDFTTFDAEAGYINQDPQHQERAVKVLKGCCPQHPEVIANRVATEWSACEAEVVKIADEGGSPLIVGALGRKFSELKDWPKAKKYLGDYLKVCQDPWAYNLLADDYLAQNDEASWLKTLQDSLAQPDYALDHAQTNVKVATHFMDKSEYDKAEPFANAAADSWAEWAMRVAEECDEHLNKWDAAETWVKRETERYGPRTRWLDWCKRTSHGDRVAAAKAAGQ